jgi:hypothetical protein
MRNQTIPSEVTESTHHAPLTYWATKPTTTMTESQPQVIDSTASALSARLPIFSAIVILRLARKYIELLKLGFEVAESTVSKYMAKRRGPPSQGWRTFLRNHAEAIAAIDLCLVPTINFECLFAFLVVGHGRRRLSGWRGKSSKHFPGTRHQAI